MKMSYAVLIVLAVALLVSHHLVLGCVVFAIALTPLLFALALTLLAFVGAVFSGK